MSSRPGEPVRLGPGASVDVGCLGFATSRPMSSVTALTKPRRIRVAFGVSAAALNLRQRVDSESERSPDRTYDISFSRVSAMSLFAS